MFGERLVRVFAVIRPGFTAACMVSVAVGHLVAAEALRYTVRDAARNRQNEYFTHGWLGHDDIGKRAATLTQRERPRARDLHSAT